MKKQFFKKLTMDEMKNAMVLGSKNITPKYAYISGFYRAGEILVEQFMTSEKFYRHEKNILVYPILYNYRHYVELHLKSLIEDTEILYDLMDKLGYLQNGNLDKKVTNILDSTHNLDNLLEYLKERLVYTQISSEEFPKDIAKYIKQIHDTDKSGQVYRYHTNKGSQENFPKEEYIDAKNIATRMEEVNNMLWAIDSHIDEYIKMSKDIIDEYESEMQKYY